MENYLTKPVQHFLIRYFKPVGSENVDLVTERRRVMMLMLAAAPACSPTRMLLLSPHT